MREYLVSSVQTLDRGAGGMACVHPDPTVTICRVLPHVITAWDVLAGILLLGVLLTVLAEVSLYLIHRREHHGGEDDNSPPLIFRSRRRQGEDNSPRE